MRLFAYFLLLVATSCSDSYFSAHTESFTVRDLASYRVGTPDFRRFCPNLGQRLFLCWDIRDCCPEASHIELVVRYYNCEQNCIRIDIEELCGSYTYVLADQDYLCSGGILSYVARLYSGEQLCTQAQHHLWTELIEIDPEA